MTKESPAGGTLVTAIFLIRKAAVSFSCKEHATISWSTQNSLQLNSESDFFSLKEVIQPQVPLRLPCYDFTPIISPTVDSCLHCWLAHWFRVEPTFVV